MSEPSWLVLFKFGERTHLEEFRKGILHMNPQRYFSKLENDCVRTDRFEGFDQIHQPKDVTSLRITDKATGTEIIIGPEGLAGPLAIDFGKRSYNLFCMYSIASLTVSDPLVDRRNLKFGDAFVAVHNAREFTDRVHAAIKSAGLGGESDLVEYYNAEKHSGDVGPFRKPSIFDYQREYRIAVYPGSADPIRLNVGSLTDITTSILSLIDINSLVKFTLARP
jgi:hypothetical protein